MPKEGRKQAVLMENVSKKQKSGFRGTSIHDLKRQNREKRSTTGVAFVDEDDVVGELIPPPAACMCLHLPERFKFLRPKAFQLSIPMTLSSQQMVIALLAWIV